MKMDELKKTICKELEKFPDKGEISIGELDILYKMVMIKEKLLRIEEIEQKMGGGEKNYGNMGGYGHMGGYGNDGGYGPMGTRSWTAEGNYGSGGHVRQKIQELMEDRSITPSEREILKRTLNQM